MSNFFPHRAFLKIAENKYCQEQNSRYKLQKIRRQAEAYCNLYASFVNYAAEYYGGGALYKAYAPEKRCSYNHRCEAEHYLTGSHRRGKRALLLTGIGTRKSHKSVRYYKSDYFYCALVL